MARRGKADAEIDNLRDVLLERGWKRHAWYLYRPAEDDVDFLVSADISRRKKDRIIKGVLQLHSIELNQISHFLWHYAEGEPRAFMPKKLVVGGHLNDYRACQLFATRDHIDWDGSCLDSFVDAIESKSLEPHRRYPTIETLVKLCESHNHFIGPPLCMYIARHRFDKAKQLLARNGYTSQSGAGDVRFGAYRYVEDMTSGLGQMK
ncbi:MAG: hypothetical protein OTI36_16170 [Beijerinckiaceae bacterium]|nr:hypothetical protein [Beijerinckiaceae bacterium]